MPLSTLTTDYRQTNQQKNCNATTQQPRGRAALRIQIRPARRLLTRIPPSWIWSWGWTPSGCCPWNERVCWAPPPETSGCCYLERKRVFCCIRSLTSMKPSSTSMGFYASDPARTLLTNVSVYEKIAGFNGRLCAKYLFLTNYFTVIEHCATFVVYL